MSAGPAPADGGLYGELIRRSGVSISAPESWLLWQLGARGPISADALAARLEIDPVRIGGLFEALGRRGYVRPDPHDNAGRVTQAGRQTGHGPIP